MPTYEYRCNACQKEFEYQQRMSDPDLVDCEACGQPRLEKLISWTSFQLKGGGWYKDLYSSSPKDGVQASVDKGTPPKKEAAAASSDGGGSGGGESSSSAPASSAPASSAPASSSSGSGGGSSTTSSAS